MDHAQTIAMATDLLADGRAEDVVQMVDPLLDPMDVSVTSTGQILLHALRAQIDVVHRNRPDRALDRLPSLSETEDLCRCVRAEVALWTGWGRSRVSHEPSDATRGLHLLSHAADLFDSIHDPRGTLWATLGQAQGFFRIDEYALMRRALDRASPLVEQLGDRQAERWLHDLSIPALRFAGRHDEAEQHLHHLRSLGRDWNDRRIRGRATAHEAALRYDLGASPSTIVDMARTAEALLRQVDTRPSYPLFAAYYAHAGALLRNGRRAEAFSILDEAEDATESTPSHWAHLRTLRARVALQRDDEARAEEILEALVERARHLPHGRLRSHLALLRGEVLARQNRLDDAYTWIQRAGRNARETGHRGRQLRCLLTLARTAAARSDLHAARSHLETAEAYDDYLSVLPFAVRRFAAEGTVAQTAGDYDDATDAYRHALAAASMMEDRYRTASLRLALAQLEGEGRAHALASAARSTFDAIDAPKEAEIATALAEGASPSEEGASSLPHPPSVPDDSSLGNTLVRASLSVPLVANTWLQTTAALLPDRWVGVYRLSSDGIASLLNERGRRPEGVRVPTEGSDPEQAPVEWLRLRSSPPTLVLGVEVNSDADADWDAARSRLNAWRPLVRLALERALLHQRRAEDTTSSDAPAPIPGDVVTESESMKAVVRRLRRLRTSRMPVLVTGESGTGKRRLAQVLHRMSERSDGPFRHVACANMQREPVDERLFGTTDADGALVPGAVHEADGGTLLIEDVDALPPPAQDSLLHLLRTGAIVPEGGTDPVPVDVRIVTTVDGPLDEAVRNDHFRPALHQSLSVLSLRMPPLRERRADIPLLVHHFLRTLRSDQLREATEAPVTQPAMEALLRYDWPGNVRQLRNELERALVHVENEPVHVIDRDVLLDDIVEQARTADPSSEVDGPDAILDPNQTLNDVLSQTEAAVIERVLRACDGQVTASAEVLGLSRQGLYKKMKRLGIDASNFQPDSEPTAASS